MDKKITGSSSQSIQGKQPAGGPPPTQKTGKAGPTEPISQTDGMPVIPPLFRLRCLLSANHPRQKSLARRRSKRWTKISANVLK